jgi:hypothetical protein
MYDVGDQAHLTVEVKDITGALASSTIAINITLPDQSVVGPFTPVNDSLGEYHYDYTTVQAGRHVHRWVGTAAAFAHTDVFDVEPAASIAIVSLASVKAQLAKKPTNTADDDELRGYLLSASENIESTCGPCAVRSFTDRAYGNGFAMYLPNCPVVSITSFTPVYSWSRAITPADVTVNPRSGKITTVTGLFPFVGDYDVTYLAGRAVIPSSLRDACKIIVQYLWDTRRGVVGVQPGGEETVVLPGWGYAIPTRAADLISGFREMSMIA